MNYELILAGWAVLFASMAFYRAWQVMTLMRSHLRETMASRAFAEQLFANAKRKCQEITARALEINLLDARVRAVLRILQMKGELPIPTNGGEQGADEVNHQIFSRAEPGPHGQIQGCNVYHCSTCEVDA